MSLNRKITIVKIPCNPSEPYSEIEVLVNDQAAGDQLIEFLKPEFVSADSIKDDAVKQAAEGLLKSSTTPLTVDLNKSKDRLSDMLRDQGHVEAFSLTRPSSSNDWKGVNMYLDEAGQLKGLPLNSRASALAGFCGFDNIQLLGNIFVGKISRSKASPKLRHLEFSIGEIDSSCAWVKNAHRDNYRDGLATGRVDMEPDSRGNAALMGRELDSKDSSTPYKWSQTEENVDVSFNLVSIGAAGATKKDITVGISSTGLTIALKGPASRMLVEIKFASAIKPGDSTWSISGNDIEVSLEKVEEGKVWKQLEL